MTRVNMHEAKAHLPRLVERALKGEAVVIARAGKPPKAAGIATGLVGHVEKAGFEMMDIGFEDAREAGGLPGPHRDPVDRILIAQARLRGLSVVMTDPMFGCYTVQVIR